MDEWLTVELHKKEGRRREGEQTWMNIYKGTNANYCIAFILNHKLPFCCSCGQMFFDVYIASNRWQKTHSIQKEWKHTMQRYYVYIPLSNSEPLISCSWAIDAPWWLISSARSASAHDFSPCGQLQSRKRVMKTRFLLTLSLHYKRTHKNNCSIRKHSPSSVVICPLPPSSCLVFAPVCGPLPAPLPGSGQWLVCQCSAHPQWAWGDGTLPLITPQQLLIYLAVKLNRGGETTDDIMVIHLTSVKT